jgi:hypothetical protein
VVDSQGEDQLIVEAETMHQIAGGQIDVVSAKLLDALIREMEDVVREMTKQAIGRLTLRVLQPGSLPSNPRTGKIRQVVAERGSVN